MITITLNGELRTTQLVKKKESHCMFEYVYFANPESTMDKRNIYSSRLELGTYLGEKVSKMIEEGFIDPDVVVPVPETSRVSAISLSEKIMVPYRELLIKE